jgi:hypothetical protein
MMKIVFEEAFLDRLALSTGIFCVCYLLVFVTVFIYALIRYNHQTKAPECIFEALWLYGPAIATAVTILASIIRFEVK